MFPSRPPNTPVHVDAVTIQGNGTDTVLSVDETVIATRAYAAPAARRLTGTSPITLNGGNAAVDLTTDLTLALDDTTPSTSLASRNFSWNFAFDGGLHNYSGDTDFSFAAVGPYAGSAMAASARIGDGTSVPKFHALARGTTSNFAICQRTAAGALRIGPNDTIGNVECFPFGFTGAVAWIPMPATDDLTIDFILSSNVGTGNISGSVYRAQVGLYSLASGSSFDQAAYAGFAWDTTNHRINETYNGPGSPASRSTPPESVAALDASFVTGSGSTSVATRRYLLRVTGPMVQLFGAPVGTPTATPTVVLVKTWDTLLTLVGRRARFLALSVSGGVSPGTNGLYGELQNALRISGVRSGI